MPILAPCPGLIMCGCCMERSTIPQIRNVLGGGPLNNEQVASVSDASPAGQVSGGACE